MSTPILVLDPERGQAMNVSGSFTDDQVVLMLLLLALAAGIGQIAWGSYKHRQAFSRPPGKPRGDQLRLWRQLLTWQVVPPSATAPAELEEFACARDFIQSSAIIGGGLAIVLISLGSAVISLVATGSLLSLLTGIGYFFGVTVLFASLIGYGLGYAYGVWQLRSRTANRVSYADLKPRRLSDYRSIWFPCIAGMLIVYAIVVPLLLVPSLESQLSLSPLGIRSWDIPIWIVETIPAAMFLALVTSEVVMVRIARLPRLLLLAHPQTAQRADNLLRAMTIGRLQGLEFTMIGFLGAAQGILLEQFLGQLGTTSQGWRPYAISFVVPWIVGGLGSAFLSFLAGRLGGTISGWPWRPVRNP